MNEKKFESTFIPCGDAVEKMELFADAASEKEVDCKSGEAAEKDSD